MDGPKTYSRAVLIPPGFKFFKHQIAITGKTGVGSSTTLKNLKATMGTSRWRFVSGGDIMREFAKRLDMTIEEFARMNREHPDRGYDRQCDQMLGDIGRKDNVIVEGRLPHIWVLTAFKVCLVCPIDVRTTRRLKDFPDRSRDEVADLITKRDADDDARYELLYPGCLWPGSDFDLVIDTSEMIPELVTEKILTTHARWVEENVRLGPIYIEN